MMKQIDWAAGGAEVVYSAAMAYVNAGKIPALSNIKNINLYINGAAVLGDLFLSNHLRGASRGVANGVGAAGVTLLTQELMNQFVLKNTTSATTTASTAGTTGANARMALAPAPAPSYSFGGESLDSLAAESAY